MDMSSIQKTKWWEQKIEIFVMQQKNERLFLSDPSPIIGYACHSLTHSLRDSRLVNLMPVNDAV